MTMIRAATIGSGSQPSQPSQPRTVSKPLLSESMARDDAPLLLIGHVAPRVRAFTRCRRGGRTPPSPTAWFHEKFPSEAVHLVELADLRHPGVDLAVWRSGRRGRVR